MSGRTRDTCPGRRSRSGVDSTSASNGSTLSRFAGHTRSQLSQPRTLRRTPLQTRSHRTCPGGAAAGSTRRSLRYDHGPSCTSTAAAWPLHTTDGPKMAQLAGRPSSATIRTTSGPRCSGTTTTRWGSPASTSTPGWQACGSSATPKKKRLDYPPDGTRSHCSSRTATSTRHPMGTSPGGCCTRWKTTPWSSSAHSRWSTERSGHTYQSSPANTACEC